MVRFLILVLLAIASLAIVISFPPIPQDPRYHIFADSGQLFGIPQFGNVLSSLLLLVPGISGWLQAATLQNKARKVLWRIFFLAVSLAGLASFYYHMQPDHVRLALDRLPIAVSLMTFLSILIVEKVNPKTIYLAPFLIIFGIISVLWWIISQTNGNGDLRLYLWVQFFPMLAIPYLLIVFPSSLKKSLLLLSVWSAYLLAKICERYDVPISHFFHAMLSGHACKHILVSIGIFLLIPYMKSD
jgi:hypothetical protein